MPCRSDYMDPTNKEQGLHETAMLLIYVYNRTDTKVSSKLIKASNDMYCEDDYVQELCTAIRAFSPEQENIIMYDGRNPIARRLADWWSIHLEADNARIDKERQDHKNAIHRQTGIAKLSPEELIALGLDH